MHHKIPNRNKPRLVTVRMICYNSEGREIFLGKKTFDARTIIKSFIEKLKNNSKIICTEE